MDRRVVRITTRFQVMARLNRLSEVMLVEAWGLGFSDVGPSALYYRPDSAESRLSRLSQHAHPWDVMRPHQGVTQKLET